MPSCRLDSGAKLLGQRRKLDDVLRHCFAHEYPLDDFIANVEHDQDSLVSEKIDDFGKRVISAQGDPYASRNG